MTYVGAVPTTGDFKVLDSITTSSATTFNLRQGGVAVYPQSANHCLVVLNGVLQTAGSSFNIVNDTIVFASSLASSDVINQILVLGNVNDIGVPSDDTVSTAKIQDNAITLAKMASGTDGNVISYDASGNPVAIATGNDGQVLTSTGAGSPPAFEDAGGGVWELLQSVDASGTATVDFTYDFPTTYNNYVIYFNDLGLASNGYLAFRAQVGGNSGVRDGGNDYGGARYGRRTNGDNASTDLGTGDGNYSMVNINNGQGVFSGDWNAQGYLWIMNPNDDHYKYFQYNANYGTSGNNINNISGGGVMYQNGNLSRVQFMNEDGHNMSGKFRLYGLKNA
jgi:hypothetical protein